MPLLLADRRTSPREARQQAQEALAAVGLADQAEQLPAELSGGQRQRVTIARALVNNPAIVWADEPTGDLDSQTAQDILDLMRRLNQENHQTFVIVTHSLRVGEQCDRIIWMRDGLIVPESEILVPSSEPALAGQNGNRPAVVANTADSA
jgi:putative ABC transport system ATP-binding protein